MTIRLAIFDCDGTLVDSQANICMAMEHAFEEAGLVPPSRHATRRIVGLSLVEAMRQLLPDAEDALHVLYGRFEFGCDKTDLTKPEHRTVSIRSGRDSGSRRSC